MSESQMDFIKPEAMNSYIWLQTVDGSLQQVEEEVAMFCPMICQEILNTGMGTSNNHAIALPERVNPAILSLILDYCRFHQDPGHSNKERKSFDEKFVRTDTKALCELASAADSLKLKPLVNLTSQALARIIEGKTPEEIREILHLPDDLTEEEKLEPLENTMDDPRIRLLNRLYAKKRNELIERQKLKNVEVKEERVDDRSIEDLLSFINSEDSKGSKASKRKNKKRRRKVQVKDLSKDEPCKALKDATSFSKARDLSITSIFTTSKSVPEVSSSVEEAFVPKLDFEESDDDDDELDSLTQEELDREVADFARRLNIDWSERLQEIRSLGHGRRFIPNILNENGSLRRCTGLDR